MSDDEFLARWSRRKQEARSGNLVPQPVEPTRANDPVPPPSAAEKSANQDLDLSSLPPIESIDAATDITAFLRKPTGTEPCGPSSRLGSRPRDPGLRRSC